MAAPSQPLFNVDDVVYLLESAKVAGSLEKYKVQQIRSVSLSNGRTKWKYSLEVKSRNYLDERQTVGDRNDLRNPKFLEFEESELGTLCDALDLRIMFLTGQLAQAQAQLNTYCDEGTAGTE